MDGLKPPHRRVTFFLKPCVQGLLGSLVLIVLLLVLIVLMFPSVGRILPGDWWSEYLAVRIIQVLTGTEAARLILGVAFGCILRYWWPQLLAMERGPWTRYNWVAINLAGLLLLAAAAPYIGSLLRDWGMTGLKTPVAEFQFAGTTRARVDTYILEKQLSIKLERYEAPYFAMTDFYIGPELSYLKLFQNGQNDNELYNIYINSQSFGRTVLDPLNSCASQAYNDYLDIESIRHALSPVAQKLRLLIQSDTSQNSSSPEKLSGEILLSKIEESVNRLKKAFSQDKDLTLKKVEEVGKNVNRLKEAIMRDKYPLLMEVDKSLDLLKEAIGKENGKCKWDKKSFPSDLEFLAKAPHIYLALALLDEYNDNLDGGISILESAIERFNRNPDLGPWIRFNINFTLGFFLDASEHEPESIFSYLDEALEIVQDTLNKIDERKRTTSNPNGVKKELKSIESLFKFAEILTKNTLAYVSAEKGVRKSRALRYAKENYDDLKDLTGLMKPKIIDTYGYAKMAFAARKVPPDFDDIEQAKALFQEARDHIKRAPETNRDAIEVKHYSNQIIRSHLEQANNLLTSR